jgi:hypothetical protein
MSTTAKDAKPLTACPKCGCKDLFIRKDFPQRIGLSIVLIAALTFLFLARNPLTFRYGVMVLIAAAIFDALLYLAVPRITVCYKCRSEFRDIPLNPEHDGFELAVAEKYRRPR